MDGKEFAVMLFLLEAEPLMSVVGKINFSIVAFQVSTSFFWKSDSQFYLCFFVSRSKQHFLQFLSRFSANFKDDCCSFPIFDRL